MTAYITSNENWVIKPGIVACITGNVNLAGHRLHLAYLNSCGDLAIWKKLVQ
jgi:hypothetical protein